MRREVRIAGSGGQGIIMAGYLLGKAASIYDDKMATQVQSYGPEARGGASKTEVIISDEDIYYPYVLLADIFISLSQQAYDKYRRDVKKDSLTFIDPMFVTPKKNDCISVPATSEAIVLGSKLVSNIIILGAAIKMTDIIKMESMEKAINSTMNGKLAELNQSALKRGEEIGAVMLEGTKI